MALSPQIAQPMSPQDAPGIGHLFKVGSGRENDVSLITTSRPLVINNYDECCVSSRRVSRDMNVVVLIDECV